VSRKRRAPLRALADLVSEALPGLDPLGAIARGSIHVNGYPVTTPNSLVRADASIRVREPHFLRGERKLAAALAVFAVPVQGRVALDVGAATGGFTRVLVRVGARSVYAVDAGHGQLLGSLRQEPVVANLERTNLADLNRNVVPDRVDLLTADLSYVSLAEALPQLDVVFAPDADLVAVVKPQFELALAAAPTDPRVFFEAGEHAARGANKAGWRNPRVVRSPVTGAGGAVELLMHASRA
jgi:23S rRNA (cytidine1920-2'-O)/16S rRNA (cytidine1409-2'-O)-methyltransferase